MGLTRGEERAAWYLAGLFDGEGWVGLVSPNGGGAKLVIANTDDSIISMACLALDELAIPYTINVQELSRKNPNHKDITNIIVGRRWAIERFINVVPFQSEPKQAKAETVRLSRRCLKPNERPVDRLVELRDAGFTQRAAAQELGIGYTTIKTWTRDAFGRWEQ